MTNSQGNECIKREKYPYWNYIFLKNDKNFYHVDDWSAWLIKEFAYIDKKKDSTLTDNQPLKVTK